MGLCLYFQLCFCATGIGLLTNWFETQVIGLEIRSWGSPFKWPWGVYLLRPKHSIYQRLTDPAFFIRKWSLIRAWWRFKESNLLELQKHSLMVKLFKYHMAYLHILRMVLYIIMHACYGILNKLSTVLYILEIIASVIIFLSMCPYYVCHIKVNVYDQACFNTEILGWMHRDLFLLWSNLACMHRSIPSLE